VSVNIYCVGD